MGMILGVLLAAGMSERMGEDKLSLPLCESTVGDCSLSVAACACDEVLVVSGPAGWRGGAGGLPRERASVPVSEVRNADSSRGQSSSVRAAALWALGNRPDCDGILFFLGDEPLASPMLALRCRRALEGRARSIVVPRAPDGKACHPVGFGRVWFEELAGGEGDVGGRVLFDRHPESVIEIDACGLETRDIDTPADYADVVMHHGRRLVVVRGAGDIATGSIARLHRAGFNVVATETAHPTVIRRTVSLAEAVTKGESRVEELVARRCGSTFEVAKELARGHVPVMVDPDGALIEELRPAAVVDAILAKRNLGTTVDMAPVVVGVGPGFTAGVDCHAVVETKRGHTLGRVIYRGSAIPNTGTPGLIGGYAAERVVHSPASGVIRLMHDIGDIVSAGETIATIGDVPVLTRIAGCLRGVIADGAEVSEGLKIADVDPRCDASYCGTISDKSLAVGGGVLEAVMHLCGVRL